VLPLFPLNLVLFPDAGIPLHIFEERYKLMVQRCLEGDSEFGVVLIKSGSEVGEPAEPHSIGTVVRIVDVERLEEGRLRIAIVGRERFRVEEITQKLPYMEGRVVTLREDAGEALSDSEADAVREAAAQHVRLLHGLRGGWVREPRLPVESSALSYFLAVRLRGGNDEKQALLEEPSASARLRAELRMMRRDAKGLKTRVADELARRTHGEA
jgi:Lon protease-like protein